MSRITYVAVILMFIIATAGFSNVTISGKHKNMTKDGAKVDCNYCHGGSIKLEKKKGQLADKKLGGKNLSQVKGCGGKDCHK